MKRIGFITAYIFLLGIATLQSCQDDPIVPNTGNGNDVDTTWVEDSTDYNDSIWDNNGNTCDSTWNDPNGTDSTGNGSNTNDSTWVDNGGDPADSTGNGGNSGADSTNWGG